MRPVLVVAVVLLLASPAAALAGPGIGTAPETAPVASQSSQDRPSVVAAYPNPIANGDRGEHVVVSIPAAGRYSNATLTDGATAVPLTDLGPGRVALSRTPRAARDVTDRPVRAAPGLRLANGGETLSIRANGSTVHRVRYGDAPEGEVATWNGSATTWRSLGATDRPVARAGPDEVRAFVLPDGAAVPTDVVGGADDRLWLAGYTLTSERVADRLAAATSRGVDVRVLVEGEPIGGRTRAGAERLDRLAQAGVQVRAVGGPYARYDVHHAKYALVDDRAIVLTENWKPAGTGGNSSRGWGVVTGQPAVVSNLSRTYDADAGWRDARPWAAYRAGRTYDRGERSTGGYRSNHDPSRIQVEGTELLVTPDNARERLLALLDDAGASIDVVQVSLGGWDDAFAVALRRAASRGVEVRLLLSDAWYAREDNAALVDRFEEWADRTGAPLSARLAESGERFEKIHAKGALVDDSVVVGSLNWNEHAAANNREVLAVLHGEEAASYYGAVFEADWDGDDGSAIPLGVLVGAAAVVALAAAVVARVKFEGTT